MSLVDELAKLEDLRRGGALSEVEFAQAKAALLSAAPAVSAQELGEHLAEQLAEVKYQNELARIDREWQIEREQYLIRGQDGQSQVPTPGASLVMAVVLGVFGIGWTIMAFSMFGTTSDIPKEGVFQVFSCVFPLFGVLFTCLGIYSGVSAYTKAQKYQAAFAAYEARRARVRPERAAGADRPIEPGPPNHNIKSAPPDIS